MVDSIAGWGGPCPYISGWSTRPRGRHHVANGEVNLPPPPRPCGTWPQPSSPRARGTTALRRHLGKHITQVSIVWVRCQPNRRESTPLNELRQIPWIVSSRRRLFRRWNKVVGMGHFGSLPGGRPPRRQSPPQKVGRAACAAERFAFLPFGARGGWLRPVPVRCMLRASSESRMGTPMRRV